MIRRDAAQDADRPHFYSQYWINVALGRPTGAAPVAAEVAPPAAELDIEPPIELPLEPPAPVPVPAPVPAPAMRTEPAKPARPKAPEKKPEAARSLSSFQELAGIDELMKNSAAMEDDVVPDIEAGAEEPAIVTDVDLDQLTPLDEEEAELEAEPAEGFEDYDDEYSYDEEDEEDEWGGRRPGKGGGGGGGKKPGKQQRQPRRREF
jgi:hypothetical protein